MTRFKPIKVSRQTELWYSRQLLAQVNALRHEVERALQQPQSPFLLDSENAITAFNTERFLAIIKKIAETDRTSFAENLAHQFVIRGNQQNAREVSENLKRQTGVDLQGLLNNSPKVAEKMHAMTQANVQLIQSIHSQYLDKVQTAVTQAVISGQLNATLAKQIKEIGGVTEKRARFIARDQAAKLNGVLTQARHEELGIKKYRWSTSGDERVRTSHAENDGKIFSYDDPPETGHPGHEINCRCVQIPVLDEKAEREKIAHIERIEKAFNTPIPVDPTDKVVLPKVETKRFGTLEFVATQLRNKIKHYREAFNPSEKRSNPSVWRTYQKELIRQLNHKDTIAFGHYRDVKDSKVFYNRKTGWVMIFVNGVYLSSMKMDRHSSQWKNYLKNGRLG
ncbi:hypothetical protein GVX81_02475 [[Haemophilus] felis]|nr:hypothetical protein [[Haemophilus] felis]NBI40168.1 hypothetical protein [[Haemophilus] felis]